MLRIEGMSLLLHCKRTAKAFCRFQPKDGSWIPMFRVPCQCISCTATSSSFILLHQTKHVGLRPAIRSIQIFPLTKQSCIHFSGATIAAERCLLARPGSGQGKGRRKLLIQRATQQNTERKDLTFNVLIKKKTLKFFMHTIHRSSVKRSFPMFY